MEPKPEVPVLETKAKVRNHPVDYGHLLCHSPSMKDILRVIDKVAISDVTVLITGETGTGKELVARTVYARSLRKEKPFIKVLCAALPDGLLESELFGYEKGAFTGAEQRKLGKFEFANNGTIFLDEIGEISLSLQAKLSQVLQEGVFSHLGGNTDVKVDVQVIVATNRNLLKAVEEGRFREDLFYRLNVVNITIPPLRERKEEIPFLVDFFLEKFNLQYNKRYFKPSSDLVKRLMKHDWPGNIRELENLIKQIIILNDEAFVWEKLNSSDEKREQTGPSSKPPVINNPQPITVPNFPLGGKVFPHSSLKEVRKKAVDKAEKELICFVLQQTHWNRKKAAGMLETSYKALLHKIKGYGLEVGD